RALNFTIFTLSNTQNSNREKKKKQRKETSILIQYSYNNFDLKFNVHQTPIKIEPFKIKFLIETVTHNHEEGRKFLQRTSEEENKQRSIIPGITFNILVNPQLESLWRRRKGVRAKKPNKVTGPRRSLAGKIIGGEFGKRIDSKERKKGP
ncbi:hypothetical protein OWV82_005078, partial [Melia azedarach]